MRTLFADLALLRRVNVEGKRDLAEQAAVAKVRRFVYISSIKAVGEETVERPFDGTEKPASRDEYGRSKLEAENVLREIAERNGLETVILRPPLVYGPGVKANFLALMRAVDRGLAPTARQCAQPAKSHLCW